MKPLRQSAHVIANRVRAKRQVYQSAVFLLVEGDDDRRFFSCFVDPDRCRIQPAYGRPNVQDALAILEADGFAGVLAVVDMDFDALEGRTAQSANLLRTDTHDVETMMLSSPALEHVLGEFGDENKLEAFRAQANQPVREVLLDLASTLGYLRWLSERGARRFRFEGFPFEQVVDRHAFRIDREAVIEALQNHSGIGVLDRELLDREIEALRAGKPDLWHVCCGHDMVAILAIGLQSVLGSQKNKAEIKPERLEASLRLAYELAYFMKTRLYVSLQAWEADHRPILATTATQTSGNSEASGQ